MKMKAPRGTVDLLPEQTRKWQYIEMVLRDICKSFNYEEVRTPVFEHTEVFQRGVGETTDIVQKEMYTFKDRGGRSITLRPEGTAGIVRAYVEHKMYGSPIQPTKLFYFYQLFRYERPQHGRMRQLNQFGVEVLGSADPSVDAEVIALAMTAYKKLGLRSIKLIINSLGDTESRKAHRQALIKHFTPHIDELCSDCKSRLMKNPLRILDCKADHEHPSMKNAPSVMDYLNDESKEYFNKVKTYLDIMEIPYEVDPTLVRGLDYYNHTAFEIMSEAEGFGAITTLLGGGRYNGLVEQLGGPSTPGIGFGMGLERLLLALEAERVTLPIENELDIFFISIGEKVQEQTARLLQELRLAGLTVDKDYQGRKIKAQFKAADRLHAKHVIILGEEELDNNVVKVREMDTGEELEVSIENLVEMMKEKCGGNK
ncbi:histidine--tRNA ligase [Pseudogracilibacillus sp. SO30301A]|uniref:histidine--tRNA ligase n=1 Tax=Pseudogracilibacillus sp. SO30301A TaxID=3098291 RepID=UPI00300DCE01